MVTSNSSSWNPAITQLITMMYRDIGVIAEDETPTAGMYLDAIFAANGLIKEWMAQGIHVWTEEEAILFFQKAQRRYLLGGTNTDNCCDANSYVQMQLTQPASAGDVTLTVDSSVGVSNGQYYGVVLDSGFAFWSTVAAVPNATQVTMAAPIPVDNSASVQNFAFAYTTKIVRPLQVPRSRQIYYQSSQGGNRLTPMTVLSRKEYMDLPNPDDPGISTQFFYTPQLVSGEYYAWPSPQNANFGARFTWYRPLQDFLTPANTADVPQEWVNALRWNIGKEMGPSFSIPEETWNRVLKMAEEKLDLVRSYDRETEPILFGMSYDEAAR